MMEPILLENYLHQNIPMTLAMGIRVMTSSPEEVILAAPIKPNINHKETVFGGSLHSVATVACWCLAYNLLKPLNLAFELVISDSHTQYHQPVTEDFVAISTLSPDIDLNRFIKTFERKGKARLKLTAYIHQDTTRAVTYHGDFVAIKIP